MENKPSRRNFLKLTLLGLGTAFVVAINRMFNPATSDDIPTPTAQPTETDTPQPTETNTPEPTSTSTETPTSTPTEIPCFGLLTPENESKLNAIGKVTFAWQAMQGAVNYKLEIILPSNQSVIFEMTDTHRDQYLEAFQMGGTYQWRVTSFDASGTTICISDSFTFEKPQYIPPVSTKQNSDGDETAPTFTGSLSIGG